MLAAESIFAALKSGSAGYETLDSYPAAFKTSWLHEELYVARNTSSWLHKFGLFIGSALTLVDQYIFRGKLPITLSDPKPDYAALKPANKSEKINYPKPDGVISFDKLSSVFLTNTYHEEDQPCHLQLRYPSIPINSNLPLYDEPAQRYCPAGVY